MIAIVFQTPSCPRYCWDWSTAVFAGPPRDFLWCSKPSVKSHKRHQKAATLHCCTGCFRRKTLELDYVLPIFSTGISWKSKAIVFYKSQVGLPPSQQMSTGSWRHKFTSLALHLEAVACSFSEMGSPCVLCLKYGTTLHQQLAFPSCHSPWHPPQNPHEGHVLEGVEWGKIRVGASIKLKERQKTKTLTATKGYVASCFVD